MIRFMQTHNIDVLRFNIHQLENNHQRLLNLKICDYLHSDIAKLHHEKLIIDDWKQIKRLRELNFSLETHQRKNSNEYY